MAGTAGAVELGQVDGEAGRRVVALTVLLNGGGGRGQSVGAGWGAGPGGCGAPHALRACLVSPSQGGCARGRQDSPGDASQREEAGVCAVAACVVVYRVAAAVLAARGRAVGGCFAGDAAQCGEVVPWGAGAPMCGFWIGGGV